MSFFDENIRRQHKILSSSKKTIASEKILGLLLTPKIHSSSKFEGLHMELGIVLKGFYLSRQRKWL